MIIDKEKQKEFEMVAKPLIEFLRKNFHPHVTVVVDCCSAELLEGICSFVDPESQEEVCQKKKEVMPLIGQLLDVWDDLPNDVKGDDELKRLAEVINKISDGMGE